MNTIEIPDIGVSAQVPASYSEMTRSQVLYVMRQFHELQRGKMSLAEFHVRVLYRLAGIRRTARSVAWERLHPAAARQCAENVALLVEQLLGFLFSKDDEQLIPAFDTVENHLPVIRIGTTRLVGPADGLMDLSFGELIAADADMTLYTTTKEEQHVDNMIARLYRRSGPMQPCGRRVEPFDIAKTEQYARIVRRLPGWQKQMILFWYAACIDNIQHGTFIINGREITFESLFIQETETSGDSLGWLSVLYDLAEKQTFGGIEATSASNVIDILTLLLNYKKNSDNARKPKETD